MCRSTTGVHTASQAAHFSSVLVAPYTAVQSASKSSSRSWSGTSPLVERTVISVGRRRSLFSRVSATTRSWSLQLLGTTRAVVTSSVARTTTWSISEPDSGRVNVHRDRALNYKTEEIQISGVDEVYLEQDVTGAVTKQLARVRLFFLAFLSGMPDVELGINDLRRQGKEVVGRHDIIPVATEEWIRLEDVQFHNIIDLQAFKESQILKFKPPDGCYIELMRFRVRPPRSRELPLQVKVKYTILQNKVDISADILVPGYVSRKMGQIPCEDVCVRMPLPECWIYMFRVEKHFRYGSVKASHRRQGKVKGIERILGAVDTLEQSLMEVSSGSAKYEHHHRAIAWRIPRLPKEGQGAYTNHTFSCKLNLTSFDQIPETFDRFCFVEYTMPHTTVSHTVCRSASISGGSGDPPEKYVRYLARYEYKVEMEFCYSKDEPAAYLSATQSNASKPAAEPPPPRPPSSDSDSDSD
ncbi:Protein stoned-B [Amphibalanus amphitrite]|uniref:Protein stoned-B n=1 Tax=Amphibalanus amphitrite TaxID=1232801 RepID=A0A6A4X1E3_AMPAM|nr:Protein stoned-B [Amphibalanus amphitrite]